MEISIDTIFNLGALAGALFALYRIWMLVKDAIIKSDRLEQRVSAIEANDAEKMKLLREIKKVLYDFRDQNKDEHNQLSERITRLEVGGCLPAKEK